MSKQMLLQCLWLQWTPGMHNLQGKPRQHVARWMQAYRGWAGTGATSQLNPFLYAFVRALLAAAQARSNTQQ